MIYKFHLNKVKSLESKQREIAHAKYKAQWQTIAVYQMLFPFIKMALCELLPTSNSYVYKIIDWISIKNNPNLWIQNTTESVIT